MQEINDLDIICSDSSTLYIKSFYAFYHNAVKNICKSLYCRKLATQKECVAVFVSFFYSLAVVADEQEIDLVSIFLDACKWWWWWCLWWLWWWHLLRHSPSELARCYLTRRDFFIGGSDEQECPVCELTPMEGQWVRDVAAVDDASGVWLWVLLRTESDFFCREMSLRSSVNFFSISFLRCKRY